MCLEKSNGAYVMGVTNNFLVESHPAPREKAHVSCCKSGEESVTNGLIFPM